jgi:hypothetical protein
MNDRVHHISVDLPDQGGPNLRGAALGAGIGWLSSVVGVVLAVTRHDLLVATYALLTATAAAGWWIAVLRWSQWRAIAVGTLTLLEAATRHDGD